MIRFIYALFMSLMSLLFGSVSVASADYPSERQYRATVLQESGGNIWAIGDKLDRHGRPRPPSQWAYGDLQIRQDYVTDVNRKFGTHHKSTDCLGNSALSKWIYREYINMYATEKLLKHKPTDDDQSGILNGGPAGWKSRFTVQYRRDVKARRDKLTDNVAVKPVVAKPKPKPKPSRH
jgi:hypothetical protein